MRPSMGLSSTMPPLPPSALPPSPLMGNRPSVLLDTSTMSSKHTPPSPIEPSGSPAWGIPTSWSQYAPPQGSFTTTNSSTPGTPTPGPMLHPPRTASASDPSEEDIEDRAQSPLLDDGPNENFKVTVRVRPPLPRETDCPQGFTNAIKISSDHKSITICEQIDTEDGRGAIYSSQAFSFDYVYNESTKQKDIYERSAKPAVISVLQGYNATVIAYGQTGTGKTFTMEGFTNDEHRGIIPRATEEVFRFIHNCQNNNSKFLVRASYVEIYNEVISDLLKPQNKNLTVRQSKERGVFVDGLSEWVVRSPQEIYGLMNQGSELRMTGSTKMSERSSRSHAIFIVICETMDVDYENQAAEGNAQNIRVGKLNIVDLAGSEKVRQSGVTGARLEETKKINWSLHELGNVIAALTDPTKKRQHIPYRNSQLTKILKDSLGGNCKTTMIACISPALESYAESLSTLKFANRAKNIKNDAIINEDLDQGAMLRKYEKELKRLRTLLAKGTVVDPQIVTALEDKNRKAEEGRVAALRALQERSWEYEEQKQTKTKLMERIQELEAILVNGGSGEQQDDAFQSAMQKVSEEYLTKLDELDKERQVIEEDKAHVERYKQILLRQRDIMVALTARLNERDDVILNLQEELDSYDETQGHMEAYVSVQREQIESLSNKIAVAEHSLVTSSNQHQGGNTTTPYSTTIQTVSSDTKVREVEARLEALRRQHSQFRSEMTERLEERNKQIATLQEERDKALRAGGNSTSFNSNPNHDAEMTIRSQQREIEKLKKIVLTHTKDRKALRTILEQRIRTKVDVIGATVKEINKGGFRNQNQSQTHPVQIEAEIHSLQSLINASIAAMEGDG
eukprot:PhF_6_TR11547/c0_g1_i1/m.18547